MTSSFPLVAVDIGNTRIKLGLFPTAPTAGTLPTPTGTLTLDRDWSLTELIAWASTYKNATWSIASVNRASCEKLRSALIANQLASNIRVLKNADLPISVQLPFPDRVGIDRLLGAVAANHVRRPDRAAIIVHVGTAVTVNLVGSDGVFLGGAIAPGLALSARALHEHTDLLPHLEMTELAAAPSAVGQDTESALRSGLFWGAIGAVKELIARMQANVGSECDLFLTGGAAPSVAPLIAAAVRHEPHLVLAGVAVATAINHEP